MGPARNQRQKKKVKYKQLILFHQEGQVHKNACTLGVKPTVIKRVVSTF